MAELTYRDAVARGIAQEMARDLSVHNGCRDIRFIGGKLSPAFAAVVRRNPDSAVSALCPRFELSYGQARVDDPELGVVLRSPQIGILCTAVGRAGQRRSCRAPGVGRGRV